MKIKFSFKNHIARRGVIYILVLISSAVIFGYAVHFKTSLKRNEIFSYFIESREVEISKLQDMTFNYMNNDVKEVNVRYVNHDDTMFNNIYSTYGVYDADVLILSKEVLESQSMNNYVPLSSENIFYNDSNYIYEGNHYGIEIHSEISHYLDEYIKYDEEKTYYLVLNNSSKHLLNFVSESMTNNLYNLLVNIIK